MDPDTESRLTVAAISGISKRPLDTTRLLEKLQQLDEQFADELAALSSGSESLE